MSKIGTAATKAIKAATSKVATKNVALAVTPKSIAPSEPAVFRSIIAGDEIRNSLLSNLIGERVLFSESASIASR